MIATGSIFDPDTEEELQQDADKVVMNNMKLAKVLHLAPKNGGLNFPFQMIESSSFGCNGWRRGAGPKELRSQLRQHEQLLPKGEQIHRGAGRK
eukprot:2830130-Amphidinium_carterae.1